ncbi:hypothetical protein DH2020_021679 [Rehmannia glutinosa]|uniref:PB1-like domain-containing protein n=1 Tax=Rehmannia glutinosa TaxID=99300 RepID=A0ABR0WFL0_REHGL
MARYCSKRQNTYEYGAVLETLLDPESNSITVVMHHGGQFVHVPHARYSGGRVIVWDYVQCGHMNMINFELWGKKEISEGLKRFYIVLNDSFKLVSEDADLLLGYKNSMATREMHIYVQLLGDEEEEAEPQGEEEEVVPQGDSGDALFEEHVNEFVDELSDNDFSLVSESVDDDDVLFEDNVDDEVHFDEMQSTGEDSTDSSGSSEEDVANGEGVLDENRVSDEEGEDDDPVFNPALIYDF